MGLWGGQALHLQNIPPITKTCVYACACVKPPLAPSIVATWMPTPAIWSGNLAGRRKGVKTCRCPSLGLRVQGTDPSNGYESTDPQLPKLALKAISSPRSPYLQPLTSCWLSLYFCVAHILELARPPRPFAPAGTSSWDLEHLVQPPQARESLACPSPSSLKPGLCSLVFQDHPSPTAQCPHFPLGC